MTTSRPSPRLVRRLVAGALLGVAVLALTACDPREAGSAAVVGTSRVTETVVDHDARTSAALLQKTGGDVPSNADLLRAQVEFQVDTRLTEAAAARQGIRVTQGQIDTLIQGSGGRAALEQQLVAQQNLWLPPNELDALARSFLVQQALGPKLVPNGTGDQQTAAVNAYLAALAKELGVAISPRYGVWDPTTLRINPDLYDLSRPAVLPSTSPAPSETPSESPSATPTG